MMKLINFVVILLTLVAQVEVDINQNGIPHDVLSITDSSGCFEPLTYQLSDEDMRNEVVLAETILIKGKESDSRAIRVCWKGKDDDTIHHSHGKEGMCKVNSRNIWSVSICNVDINEAEDIWYALSVLKANGGSEIKLTAKLNITNKRPASISSTSKPDEPHATERPASISSTSKPDEPHATERPASVSSTSKPDEPHVADRPGSIHIYIAVITTILTVLLIISLVVYLYQSGKANSFVKLIRNKIENCTNSTAGKEDIGMEPIPAGPTVSPQVSVPQNPAAHRSGVYTDPENEEFKVSSIPNGSDPKLQVGSVHSKATLNSTVLSKDLVVILMPASDEPSLNNDIAETSAAFKTLISSECKDFHDPGCTITNSVDSPASSLESTESGNLNLRRKGPAGFKGHANDRGYGIRLHDGMRDGRGDGDQQFKGGRRGVGRGGDGVSGDMFFDDSNARREQNGKKLALPPVKNSDDDVKRGEHAQLLGIEETEEIEGEFCKRKKDST